MALIIRIGGRYTGPPSSANGGYACGLFARVAKELLGVGPRMFADSSTVQLLAPPPVETDLRLALAGSRMTVWSGDLLVATATATANRPPRQPVPSLDVLTVQKAEQHFAGASGHPFPGCFVCGPESREGGLRLTPVTVPGQPSTLACTWVPGAQDEGEDGVTTAEMVWAVLDCPGGWSLDGLRRPRVLSRMTATVRSLPRLGETTVVVAKGEPTADRIARCATALFSHDGTELAHSEAMWARL